VAFESGGGGGVVGGAAFDHWDSRVGDPQLHTHLVISNKVDAVLASSLV
jgi:hypothetical protein